MRLGNYLYPHFFGFVSLYFCPILLHLLAVYNNTGLKKNNSIEPRKNDNMGPAKSNNRY